MSNRDNFLKMPDLAKLIKTVEEIEKIHTYNFDKITKTFENMDKVHAHNFDKIVRSFENFGKIKTPEFDNVARIVENFSKLNVPEFDNVTRIVEKFGKLNLPDFNRILLISETLFEFEDKISDLDWTNFELTEEDLVEANEIFESEKPREEIFKELDKKGGGIKSLLVFICTFFTIMSGVGGTIDFVEDRVIPAYQSVTDYIEKEYFDSNEKNTLNDIHKNFRIVTKDNLVVREGEKVDSGINGKLNSRDVVQIVKKKRNWTYVFYSNYEDDLVIEGWVFTRYLKEIKQ